MQILLRAAFFRASTIITPLSNHGLALHYTRLHPFLSLFNWSRMTHQNYNLITKELMIIKEHGNMEIKNTNRTVLFTAVPTHSLDFLVFSPFCCYFSSFRMFAFACCDPLYFVTFPFEDMAEVPSSIYQGNKRIQKPF